VGREIHTTTRCAIAGGWRHVLGAGYSDLATPPARTRRSPPADNAEFAAKFIPRAKLDVIPGRVDHEIFVNECNQDGRGELPEACIDAPAIDRDQIHRMIADAALNFFGTSLTGRAK